MADIVLDNVTKRYPDGFEAVKAIDLDIADGEFMILVGPSGCGKSTTLRMVAGLEEITAGEIIIGDRVVNDLPPKDRDIAMVFQNYALYPHMTVRENMGFALKLAKVSKTEIAAKVEQACGLLDSLVDLRLVDLGQLEREAHVLAHGHVRVVRVVLEDHGDVAILR